MYSRSLFVLCIVRKFLVRYSFINDAYVERTIIQRVKRWRKINCKSRYKEISGCKEKYLKGFLCKITITKT